MDAAHAEMDALKGAIAQKESGEGNIEELAGVADDISADALLKKVRGIPAQLSIATPSVAAHLSFQIFSKKTLPYISLVYP